MKKRKLETAAIVTIYEAANMTKRGRMILANWLRKQAKFLLSHHDELSPRFTARYRY